MLPDREIDKSDSRAELLVWEVVAESPVVEDGFLKKMGQE